jgi:hypothetical protein
MDYYFSQIVPEMDWRKAKSKLWRSVEDLGKEGSTKKEKAIRNRVFPGKPPRPRTSKLSSPLG